MDKRSYPKILTGESQLRKPSTTDMRHTLSMQSVVHGSGSLTHMARCVVAA
jgi:hypothetical protein